MPCLYVTTPNKHRSSLTVLAVSNVSSSVSLCEVDDAREEYILDRESTKASPGFRLQVSHGHNRLSASSNVQP